MRAFRDKGRLAALLESFPLRLVLNARGAAARSRPRGQPANFSAGGVAMIQTLVTALSAAIGRDGVYGRSGSILGPR